MNMPFLQIELPAESAVPAAAPEVTTKTLSILDLMLSGGIGGQLIMGTMLILSVLAVYLFVNRLSAIQRANKLDDQFMRDIKDY
ncbi:MAG: MotA/TolQ/ExbB proton channel family protein, partial [Schleiferiaceae bacterium]